MFYQIFYVFSEGWWFIERMDAFDGFDYHYNEQEVELAKHEIDQGINVEKKKRYVADERKRIDLMKNINEKAKDNWR